MIDPIFQKFFSTGLIKVGPTIVSHSVDGNFLGTVQLLSTQKDSFLEKKYTVVFIREFNNQITEELFNALNYLSIDKVKFDYYMNSLFLLEWEDSDIKIKPDISSLKRRAYIFRND